MRYFYLIIFLVIINTVLLTKSYAVDTSLNCDTNNNGKVSITNELNTTPGQLDTCYAPADSFEITFDSIALCTANPETEYGAGRNIDDTCTYVLKRTDDQITINMSNTASTSFPAVLPGVGTYTHALLTISNLSSIKAEMEFENGIAFGANDARNGVGAGTFCGPPLAAQGNYNISTFYTNWPLQIGDILANCYNTSRSANKNSGTLETDTLWPFEFSNSVAGLGLLLDSDYNLASDEADTAYHLLSYQFATPATVDTETVSMNYKFSTDQAHRIYYMAIAEGQVNIVMSYLGDFNLVVEAE